LRSESKKNKSLQVFTSTLTVAPNDLDDLNHVNNIVYVKWVQQIAERHWHANAKHDILKNYFWVLTSHHIKYKSQAFLGDEILLKTFVTHSKGVRSTRQVDVYNNFNQQLLATSTTEWCLMDAKTKKPTRITDTIKSLFD